MNKPLEGEIVQKGRPPKFNQDYVDKMTQIMSQGRVSKAAICANLDLDPKTLNVWLKEYPELQAAFDKGRTTGQDFWERMGIAGILGQTPGKFNASTYALMVTNLFPDDFKLRASENTSTININLVRDIERIQKLDLASLEQENLALEEKIKLLENK